MEAFQAIRGSDSYSPSMEGLLLCFHFLQGYDTQHVFQLNPPNHSRREGLRTRPPRGGTCPKSHSCWAAGPGSQTQVQHSLFYFLLGLLNFSFHVLY